MTDQVPSVGRVVHYVSYGTPGGEYPSTCRAAMVTEVENPKVVSLAVLNPEGVFFNRHVHLSEDEAQEGTCHWPERV